MVSLLIISGEWLSASITIEDVSCALTYGLSGHMLLMKEGHGGKGTKP
jgi:hypothetical protein